MPTGQKVLSSFLTLKSRLQRRTETVPKGVPAARGNIQNLHVIVD